MKVAIMFDNVSGDINAATFDAMVNNFKFMNAEIKILCRGMEGREGDRYDILRGRSDVFWSNGMPPLLEVEVKLGWKPDITMNNTAMYQDTQFFHKAEILL